MVVVVIRRIAFPQPPEAATVACLLCAFDNFFVRDARGRGEPTRWACGFWREKLRRQLLQYGLAVLNHDWGSGEMFAGEREVPARIVHLKLAGTSAFAD